MVRNTPALGFNTWNTFGENINEQLIRELADAMVDTGLLAAGYNYLVIDDCWAEKQRDEEGRLVPDHRKFPGGMKALADYVHSKGLLFGMYSCAGTLTCAGYPSSFDYEFLDAATFASWGVDFLKYDYCNKPDTMPGPLLYRRMGAALESCGRDILFSACSWGADDTRSWIKSTGANMWRSTGDIFDNWASIKSLYQQQLDWLAYNGAGCFNDMDMLVVGMNSKGNVGLGGCTPEEYRTHISLWAMLASPLMIGCDIRSMDDLTKELLFNADMLAIDQDPGYRQVYCVGGDAECHTLVRLLEGGDFALCMVNLTDSPRLVGFHFTDLGICRGSGRTLTLRDVWTGETLEPANGTYRDTLAPHTCRLFRARQVEAR